MTEALILIVLFILSAFFSVAETALISVPRLRANPLVAKLKEKPGDFLTTILIGNNLVNIGAAALATSITINYLLRLGMKNEAAAIGIATGIMTFLILVFGEIIPKMIALRHAESLSAFFAPSIVFLNFVFKPIAYFIGIFSRPIIQLFKGVVPEKGALVTEEDIKAILSAGEKEGVIEKHAREMITSIFEFGDTIVHEVMTRRPDIIAAPLDINFDSLCQLIIETGHSRIPIYEGNLDNVMGVIYAKDLLKAMPDFKIREILHPAIFISEAKKVSALMREMQSAHTHLAIIVDEYGKTTGVVSLEDLIEEIVGEIHDEFERGERKIK